MITSTSSRYWAPILAGVFLLACGGGDDSAGESAPEADAPAPASAMEPAPSGPIDQELASRGESLFNTKGCAGCHRVGGGKFTGPDLLGVTERREYGWVINMITNPDSMIRSDSIARGLFQEYMTPMMNLGVSREEARALYEFLRSSSQGD